MITRPDQYKHQNDAYAIVDNADTRGGIFDVEDLTTGNLNAIPADKRKLRSTIANGEDSKLYVYSGTTLDNIAWGNTGNWALASGGSITAGKGTIINGGAIDLGTEPGTYEPTGWMWQIGTGATSNTTIGTATSQFYTLSTLPAYSTGSKYSYVNTIPERYESNSGLQLDSSGTNSLLAVIESINNNSNSTVSSSILNKRTSGQTVTTTGVSVNSTTTAQEIKATSNYAFFKGIEYGDDYSANYSNRSLVDKEYVDSNSVSYTHPTGFSDQPSVALTGASVISQIDVTTEGHVNGVVTRALSGLAPTGGTTGQVLKKNSNANYDYTWQADSTSNTVPLFTNFTATDSNQLNTYISQLPDDLGGAYINIYLSAAVNYTVSTSWKTSASRLRNGTISISTDTGDYPGYAEIITTVPLFSCYWDRTAVLSFNRVIIYKNFTGGLTTASNLHITGGSIINGGSTSNTHVFDYQGFYTNLFIKDTQFVNNSGASTDTYIAKYGYGQHTITMADTVTTSGNEFDFSVFAYATPGYATFFSHNNTASLAQISGPIKLL